MRMSAFFCLAAWILAACTTMQPLPDGAAVSSTVRPGDRVQLTTDDGRIHELTVTAVTAGAIEGKDAAGVARSVPLAKVRSGTRRAVDGGATALVVVGVIGGVAALAIALDDDDDSAGGGSGY